MRADSCGPPVLTVSRFQQPETMKIVAPSRKRNHTRVNHSVISVTPRVAQLVFGIRQCARAGRILTPPISPNRCVARNEVVDELAGIVLEAGAADLADRLDRALTDEVKLLALTIDERAIMLNALEDPPEELAELRVVLLADHQWRRGEGLD
jgi:hypothetical protein